MTTFPTQFATFAQRMEAEGLPPLFIDTFAHYYQQLLAGHTGLIAESEIRPVQTLPDAESFPVWLAEEGERALAKTAVLKLNGGLGTGMGLEQAKSLLVVKDDLTFLDIIARQAIQTDVPLILMNSFATHAESMFLFEKYPQLQRGLPHDFLQHKAPKVTQADFRPVEWPENPELEWCPPGHGDIYTALVTSGTLAALLEAGYEYAFVSNADNLGAVIDISILGYMAHYQLPFMMEVADRTEMDKKGGHLAQRADGQLILRESAQCPKEDTAVFQDITHHKYFNTNNLWLHLPTLKQVLESRNYQLGLPLIRNAKTADPRDPSSPPVYQLETAMGSAIAIFEGAQAIRVPRSRFAPVKTTSDLLAIRSDAYSLTPDSRIVPNPCRQLGQVVVELDSHYKFVTHLDERFPQGAPSLLHCSRLHIKGDFRFGRFVVCQGDVRLVNETPTQITIPDKALLEGTIHHSG